MEAKRRSSKAKRIKTEAEFEELLAQEIGKIDSAPTQKDSAKIEQNTQSTENPDEINDSQKTLAAKNRINLGDSLFILIGKSGEKTFHYRLSMNRNDTSGKIGNYPEFSFEKARKISDERRAEISTLKNADKLSALKAKVKEQRIRKKKIDSPCFTRLSDAGTLYENVLRQGIKSLEHKIAALLTLLLPTLYEGLISTTKGTYNSNSNELTIYNFDSHINNIVFQPPRNLANLIFQLKHSTSNYQDNQPLFPELFNMTPKDRNKTLTDIYENEYTQNPITAVSLREFFAFTAEKHGGFNKEFISKLMTKRNRKKHHKDSISTTYLARDNSENQFYWRQEHAAIYWYADQVLRGGDAFNRNSTSNPQTLQNEWKPLSSENENSTIPAST